MPTRRPIRNHQKTTQEFLKMEYTSTINCQFHINNFEAENEKEYIEALKDYFYETHSICLRTDEITNIKCEGSK